MSGAGGGTRHMPGANGLPPRGETGIKDGRRRTDRRIVIERLPVDRRTGKTTVVSRPGLVRRLAAALRDGLYRPLAEDDDRAAYWVRHVRIGVLLTEVAAWSVVGYVLLTETPGRHQAFILGLAGLVILTVPGLLLLPLHAMMR